MCATSPAPVPLDGLVVTGSIGVGSFGQSLSLPSGTSFNGSADFTHDVLTGQLSIPPLRTTLSLFGLRIGLDRRVDADRPRHRVDRRESLRGRRPARQRRARSDRDRGPHRIIQHSRWLHDAAADRARAQLCRARGRARRGVRVRRCDEHRATVRGAALRHPLGPAVRAARTLRADVHATGGLTNHPTRQRDVAARDSVIRAPAGTCFELRPVAVWPCRSTPGRRLGNPARLLSAHRSVVRITAERVAKGVIMSKAATALGERLTYANVVAVISCVAVG